MGNIKVSIEAFGERALERIFPSREIENINIRSLVEKMVREQWDGKDSGAERSILAETSSSGGYSVTHRVGGFGEPVRYEPVNLNGLATRYRDEGSELPTLRFAVSGLHEVGYGFFTNPDL